MMETTPSTSLDARNSEFWNELCGTYAAGALGIRDRSADSLRKFDEWYFKYYDYLDRHIQFDSLRDKSVLEVGLGYGSVSQRIAAAGAIYTGLDIAEGPVEMVNYRCALLGLSGRAMVGSILSAPFPDDKFDRVIAIGCFHHTGSIRRAIDESFRVLVPGGRLILMVYNAYSYRRIYSAPASTIRYGLSDYFGVGSSTVPGETDRMAYDSDRQGRAAPHTDFTSMRQLSRMCSRFRSFEATLENTEQTGIIRKIPRKWLLQTIWPKILGLDIYATVTK
jgi:SAM-dependent methyltransferase